MTLFTTGQLVWHRGAHTAKSESELDRRFHKANMECMLCVCFVARGGKTLLAHATHTPQRESGGVFAAQRFCD